MGAKVLSVDFSLLGAKVQGNEKSVIPFRDTSSVHVVFGAIQFWQFFIWYVVPKAASIVNSSKHRVALRSHG